MSAFFMKTLIINLAFLLPKYQNSRMAKENKTPPNFETAMVELEELVSKIEDGNLPLEDSLKEFEKGIQLSRVCQQALSDAEQRVKILTADGEQEFTTDLN